jgi:hypothetical protein
VDEHLKDLTKQLGQAIDQAINESEAVKEATSRIREAGYEAFLMIEATICLAQRDNADVPNGDTNQETTVGQENYALENMMSSADVQFLKSLQITVEGIEDSSAGGD